MRKAGLCALALTALGGCLDWQATYDNAAWRECASNPDDHDRRACQDRVIENSREQRRAD